MVKKYTLTQMAEGFSSMSAVQAKLNYADELDVSSKKSLQLFKLMVSGGELTLPQKYAEDRDVPIRAKLLFCCNELPDLHNLQAEAIMDRMLLIGFKNSVKKRDSTLADYLYEERDRIVSMAFDAYMETKNKRKFTDSKFAQDLFKIYSVEQNSNKNFVNDCLKLATDGKIASSRLFDEYLIYCQANGISKPLSRHSLYQEILTKFAGCAEQKKIRDPNTGRSVQGFTGIAFKDDEGENIYGQ